MRAQLGTAPSRGEHSRAGRRAQEGGPASAAPTSTSLFFNASRWECSSLLSVSRGTCRAQPAGHAASAACRQGGQSRLQRQRTGNTRRPQTLSTHISFQVGHIRYRVELGCDKQLWLKPERQGAVGKRERGCLCGCRLDGATVDGTAAASLRRHRRSCRAQSSGFRLALSSCPTASRLQTVARSEHNGPEGVFLVI